MIIAEGVLLNVQTQLGSVSQKSIKSELNSQEHGLLRVVTASHEQSSGIRKGVVTYQ